MSIHRPSAVRFAVAIALALVLLGVGMAALSVQPVAASRPVDDIASDNLVFLPVVARPWPSVTGVYSTVASNPVDNCDIDLKAPPAMWVTVTQNLTNLTFAFPTGNSTGALVTGSGAFSVSQRIAVQQPLCPGGCDRITSGTFQRQAAPLTFDAKSTFISYKTDGTEACRFSFDLHGKQK
jgi:hypothetical protein